MRNAVTKIRKRSNAVGFREMLPVMFRASAESARITRWAWARSVGGEDEDLDLGLRVACRGLVGGES